MATLAFVPVGYGGTEAWSRDVINGLAGVAFVLWAGSLLVRPRRIAVSRWQVVPALLLLAIGWGMALNAKSVHDLNFWEYVPRSPVVAWLPGSVDSWASTSSMVRLSALLGMYFITCDLCARRRWRVRFITTAAVVGTATSLFGIYQKVSPEPFVIWPVPRPPPSAFATFWYHGNAASFLNLILPLTIGLAVSAFRRSGNHLARAGWLGAAGCVIVGLMINVSKAGHAMALLLMVGFLAMSLRWVPQIVFRHGWRQPLVLGGLALAGAAAVLSQLDWAQSITRWQEYFARTGADSRFHVAAICLALAGRAGGLGFGPGTFDSVFQHHVMDTGQALGVRWKFAHNDYLQTLIEWGWAGMLLWGLFWAVPLRVALAGIWGRIWPTSRTVKKSADDTGVRRQPHREMQVSYSLLVGPAVALLGMFGHAAYDFPLQIAGIQVFTVVIAGVVAANVYRPSKTSEDDH